MSSATLYGGAIAGCLISGRTGAPERGERPRFHGRGKVLCPIPSHIDLSIWAGDYGSSRKKGAVPGNVMRFYFIPLPQTSSSAPGLG